MGKSRYQQWKEIACTYVCILLSRVQIGEERSERMEKYSEQMNAQVCTCTMEDWNVLSHRIYLTNLNHLTKSI